MSTDKPNVPTSEKTAYESPKLERFGAAADLTQTRSMRGRMDGGMGGNMSRTG